MELIDSRTEARRLWFVSLASKKLGADIDENSCKILEHAPGAKCSTHGAILFITASRAGYTAFKFPLRAVIRVWIDY